MRTCAFTFPTPFALCFSIVLCVALTGCGDIIQGFKEPLIELLQPMAVDNDDLVEGTVVELAAGRDHYCALMEAGNVRCWGKNEFGQLGYGNTLSVGDLVDPSGSGDVRVGCTVKALALGDAHTCGLCDSGRLRCWGKNAFGQLGLGSTNDIGDNEFPESAGEISLGGRVVQVAAGAEHTCALLSNGKIRCWGQGTSGQLGLGNSANVGDDELPSTAGFVSLSANATQVVAGAKHTCALLVNGEVSCWGSGTGGVLGYGNTQSVGATNVPSSVGNVPLGGTAVGLSSKFRHTCALMDTGRVRCWGFNNQNQSGFVETSPIGDDETPESKGNARVPGSFDRIVLGYDQTCARLDDGTRRYLCWGGTPNLPFGIGFFSVAGGLGSWCGVHPSGNTRCAGSGSDGRLGYGNEDALSSWPLLPVDLQDPDHSLSDPLFASQWHLSNTGQNGAVPGEDVNVLPVWADGNRGEGVVVTVVDDGMEISHPDLFANVVPGASYNYLTGSSDPGGPDSPHGTAVGGIIAARDENGFGVRGVAPRARLIGYNMLQASVVLNIADSMVRNLASVFVSNNSWGPTDSLGAFALAPSAWEAAVVNGVTNGRDGKGISYILAAGNGALSPSTLEPTDRSNYDGYSSHWAVTTVCAVGDDGEQAFYSEPGSNLWVCGPSLGSSGQGIYTTDLVGADGYNVDGSFDLSDLAYTRRFNGTSAATPMVSGVVALMYAENPELTWRDARLILAQTARQTDLAGGGWVSNGAVPAYQVSDDYGFGVVDAEAAVNAAKTWVNVGPLLQFAWPVAGPETLDPGDAPISDEGVPNTSSVTVTGSGIDRLEYVAVEVNLSHADWGNLEITLSRTGALTTSSVLATPHQCYNSPEVTQLPVPCFVSGGFFRFGTARHLGEPADGEWQLTVRDMDEDAEVGTFNSWRLRFYGEGS